MEDGSAAVVEKIEAASSHSSPAASSQTAALSYLDSAQKGHFTNRAVLVRVTGIAYRNRWEEPTKADSHLEDHS